MLDSYKEAFETCENYIIVNTDKVGTAEVTDLKKALSESGATFSVVKNTLFRIAAQDSEQPTRIQEIENATGVIFCGEDVAAAAKALAETQKEHEILDTKVGVLFGSVTGPEKVKELADIPPREVLLAQLLNVINAPLTGFMQTARGNIREFTYALTEIQKQKEGAE